MYTNVKRINNKLIVMFVLFIFKQSLSMTMSKFYIFYNKSIHSLYHIISISFSIQQMIYDNTIV